jgi:hypothetical protein
MIKLQCFEFLFLLLFMTSCINAEKSYDYIDEIHKITSEISAHMKKKDKLNIVGSGGALKNCVESISLTYQTPDDFNETTAIYWCCEIVDMLLTRILESSTISRHLCPVGFSSKNIHLVIYNTHDDCEINVVTVDSNMIFFKKFSYAQIKTTSLYSKDFLIEYQKYLIEKMQPNK